MLSLLLGIITALPASSPSPEASAAPLKTIITVRSSPLCDQFAKHANSAIDSAVRNDAVLGNMILGLRSSDLAENDLRRRNEIMHLGSLADSMYRDYRAGLVEVSKLRDLAKSAKDEDEKTEIKASADALGGVLYRQHLIQRDLDGFLAYLDASDMQASTNRDEIQSTILGDSVAEYPYSNGYGQTNAQLTNWGLNEGRALVHPYLYHTPEGDVQMATNASHDFQARDVDIMRDELTAGAHITQATDRC
jgi:hypothetical protein